MGWTFTHKEPGTKVKDFFRSEFGEGVQDVAVVGFREAYIAYKTKNEEIIGIVCLLDYRPNDYYNFGYKDIDEDMGPYATNCPERILKQLTPPSSEYAKEWRQKCWEKIQNKKKRKPLKDGDVIKFAEPIQFTNGDKIDTFKIVKKGRKIEFYRYFMRYKIKNWRERDYKILDETII